jgi:hypothetical protein
MGKPINNKTNNMDELLNHLNSETDDLDAFEKEALEGFAMLESKQEALDLKQSLDKKIEEELFTEKKKPVFIYWSAAAGVALLIGLMFLFKNVNKIEEADLAQNTQNEVSNVDGMNTNPGKDKTEATIDNAIASEAAGEGAKMAEQKTIATTKNSDANEHALSETAAREESPALEDMEAPKKSAEASDRDDANYKAIPPSPNMSAGAAVSPEDKKIKDAFAKTAEDERKDQKNDEQSTRNIVKEKKKESAKSAPASAPEKDVKGEIDGAFEKSNISAAKLTIKETELTALITKFFSDKSYKKTFKCTLTINSSNQVEEVVFTDNNQFKRADARELSTFLKKLKCFKNNEYSLYSTYTIHYLAE